ncbi:hypothetical protein [Lentilactobacillus hilgardii]|uniref:hypothetical protein n=1 Tax=Lentilactobacillus hilgardii TaxID=1588 RepID=UPI0039E9B73D
MAYYAKKPSAATKIPISAIIIIISLIMAGMSTLATNFVQRLTPFNGLDIRKFALPILSDITKISLTIFIVTLLILVIPLLVFGRNPLKSVLHKRLNPFLFAVGSYVGVNNDIELLLYPDVKKVNDGFAIEAIGDLQDKLLGLNDSLSNHLARHKSQLRVSESYVRNGWVIYVTETDFRADQLED